MTKWVFVVVLLTYICCSKKISIPNSPSYVGAVVEFSPSFLNNSWETLRENTKAYIEYIEKASENNADIVVFPEDGLTTIYFPAEEPVDSWATVVPAASEYYVPCAQNTIPVSDTLRKLSCAAKDYHIYLVVNLVEKLLCEGKECTPDKATYYNCDVVFDRTGKIIARYRKTHLFREKLMSVTTKPEIVTFDTDFGVTFGIFTCFDILFQEPPLRLTRERNITDIVYPTAWFSETPFLTAVQTQAGWSFAENVNLLASGYKNSTNGNTGSGIYLGRKGIAKAIIGGSIGSEILVAEIPKMKQTSVSRHDDQAHSSSNGIIANTRGTKSVQDASKEVLLLYDNLSVFTTVPFKTSTTKKVCHGDFCCEFKIQVTIVDPNSYYRMGVFDGIRTYGGQANAATRICAIFQCSNDSIESCGSAIPSPTIFTSVDVTGTIHNYRQTLTMPSTLDSSLLPLQNWTYNEHSHDDHIHVYMTLNGPTKNVVTFGLYSRNFPRDNANSASKLLSVYTSLFLILLVFLL